MAATLVGGLYCITVLIKVLEGDSTFVVKASFEIDGVVRPILRILRASDLFDCIIFYNGPVCKIIYALHKPP